MKSTHFHLSLQKTVWFLVKAELRNTCFCVWSWALGTLLSGWCDESSEWRMNLSYYMWTKEGIEYKYIRIYIHAYIYTSICSMVIYFCLMHSVAKVVLITWADFAGISRFTSFTSKLSSQRGRWTQRRSVIFLNLYEQSIFSWVGRRDWRRWIGWIGDAAQTPLIPQCRYIIGSSWKMYENSPSVADIYCSSIPQNPRTGAFSQAGFLWGGD